MTDAEQKLWYQLRAKRFSGFKFRRQVPIGNYIVDFVCKKSKVIVEVDGSQHQQQKSYDKTRTQFLKQQGFTVLRFWNNEVLNEMDGVLEKILDTLSLGPSPSKGEGRNTGKV